MKLHGMNEVNVFRVENMSIWKTEITTAKGNLLILNFFNGRWFYWLQHLIIKLENMIWSEFKWCIVLFFVSK